MTGFIHEALLYADEEELLAGTVPLIRDAVADGAPVMVAIVRERADRIAAALGEDAAAVRFADMAELGRNPGRIIPAWTTFVAEAGDRPAFGIGEPVWPGRDAMQIDECMRHESLLNLAFAEARDFTLICPYDATRLDDHVLDGACGVHGPSPALELQPFAGRLEAPPPGARELAFTVGRLGAVRDFVTAHAQAAGLDGARTADLALAVSELAANSVRHGGGSGIVRAWTDGGTISCEVADAGLIDNPLAGRIPPGLRSDRGRGLWIVHQLCDLVRVRSGPAGTQVRVTMDAARAAASL